MKRNTIHSFTISWATADRVLYRHYIYWSERNHTYFTKLPSVRKGIPVGKRVRDLRTHFLLEQDKTNGDRSIHKETSLKMVLGEILVMWQLYNTKT